MGNDVQRAIDRQAKIEASIRRDWNFEQLMDVLDHLKLARDVIAVASKQDGSLSAVVALDEALTAWAGHVNGEP